MATHAIGKINGRLTFLYRNQNYPSYFLRRLLCNRPIQPHFDFACLGWYPSLHKKGKGKLQYAQNKCVRFCLILGNRAYIGVSEFMRINWLPIRERFEQCVCVNIFNFFAKIDPHIFLRFLLNRGIHEGLSNNIYFPIKQQTTKCHVILLVFMNGQILEYLQISP